MEKKKIDFDDFSNNYIEIVDSVNKCLFGETSDYFSEYKIKVLRRILAINSDCILDFGCGIGSSIKYLNKYFQGSEIIGVDVSNNSLEMARKFYKNQFFIFNNGFVEDNQSKFDVIFVSCVFHHINSEEHNSVLLALYKMLSKDGIIVMFEHNKLNPLTRYSVSKCEFDRDAILLGVNYSKKIFKQARFTNVKTRYCTFFPKILSMLRPLEKLLGWCFFGGQYYLVAKK